jgi:hypothetical protein
MVSLSMFSSTKEAKIWKEVALLKTQQLDEIKETLHSFLEKNYSGGSKADREDYTCMVTCKDIYELYELYKKINN